MTRHYVAERRKRNRELAAIDKANRCRECFIDLRPLPKTYVSLDGLVKWCSPACRDQYLGVKA